MNNLEVPALALASTFMGLSGIEPDPRAPSGEVTHVYAAFAEMGDTRNFTRATITLQTRG